MQARLRAAERVEREPLPIVTPQYTVRMPLDEIRAHRCGDVVALRYVTTDGRIEMCWPCRVVEDTSDLLALFIAAGSPYKAGPKLTAQQKRAVPRRDVPPEQREWLRDTLRLMFPGRCHSVSLSWSNDGAARRLHKYFVNLEEPFRRTAVGFDTQDHTLDVEVTPELEWRWRDEDELADHIAHGFYTPALAAAARAEGEQVLESLLRGEHACTRGWPEWRPAADWRVPDLVNGWDTAPRTAWERRLWAYGDALP
jgi:predicted RNA-binding protein associated with RNAse of E/G family